MLRGSGDILGPPRNALFNSVIELIVLSLPQFAAALPKNIENENGLNGFLSLFISKIARQKNLPFIVQHQSIEDMSRGDSPAPDIGIHLDIEDDPGPPPKITVFEGKRLSLALPKKRRREYVVGHDEYEKHVVCGGIERFKHSIHGREVKHAGMIGYIQDGSPDGWHERINIWIAELSKLDKKWLDDEKLQTLSTIDKVSKCSSIVRRCDTDNLQLIHLWIDLVPGQSPSHGT